MSAREEIEEILNLSWVQIQNRSEFMVSEKRYYRNVAVWLEKKGYYIGRTKSGVYRRDDLFIERGRQKAKVDVTGVRNVGKSFFDDIEIVAIEVKHDDDYRPLGLQEIAQASSYQIYAHNCYLATTDRIEITSENEADAKSRGVGLLKIPFDFYKKRAKQVKIDDVELILTPNEKTPNEAEMLEFLVKLRILRCSICGCYFNTSMAYEEIFPNLPPKESSFKRLERNKVFEVFPDRTDDQFDTKHRHTKSKMWRHLCLSCIVDLEELYGIDELKRDVSIIKKELAKLKQSL